MNVDQGPTPREKSEVELVAAIMQEDILLAGGRLQLRQPPINEDDYDSWAFVGSTEYRPDKWLHVAQNVIDAIDRRRAAHE